VTFLTSFKLGSAIRAESNNPSFVWAFYQF
jgi:hypothetical protein